MINIKNIKNIKKGWAAMDASNKWWWYSKKPMKYIDLLQWLPANNDDFYCCINNVFDIAPVDDWTKSLIKVGEK